jgi:hypothetical protein
MTFDINAPIEQQYTRNGKKVLYVYDTEQEISQPIIAVVEGKVELLTFSRDGMYALNQCDRDLITRPAKKKLCADYLEVFHDGSIYATGCTDRASAIAQRDDASIAIVHLIYDPNDHTAASAVVWEKK